MNSDSAPEASKSFDLLVGENGQNGQNRVRYFNIPNADATTSAKIQTMEEFVIPTGRGYFFVPSLHTLSIMT
jgi:hypothetical protein